MPISQENMNVFWSDSITMVPEWNTFIVFVSPAKQKRDICIVFPVLSSSTARSAQTFVGFLRLDHFLRNYKC